MSIAREAGRGVAWTTLGKTVSQLAGVVVTLALVRILTPEDFGLVGMILVVTGFFSVFGEMGFAAALVQKSDVEERHRSSVFWLNLGAGAIVTLILFAAAPLVADFYGRGELIWLLRVLGMEFALAPFQMVQHAVLAKRMDFRSLAAVEIVAALVSNGVGLGLALAGYGVWALVGRTLAATASSTIVLWLMSSWRPRLLFDRGALRELWSFGSNLLGYNVVSYWASNIDDLLIGRVLGARSLGLYGRAYATMMMPVSQIGRVLARVMFPTFSKLKADPDETKRLYLRVLTSISFVTFPVMFGLSVLAEPFIIVLYGRDWLDATGVLRIYCIVGASHAIGTTTAWIYTSQGRTDWLLRWGLAAATTTTLAIAVGLYLGSIEWVAACYAIATVLVLGYPRFAIPGRLIGLRPSEVFLVVRGALGAALIMAGALVAIGWVSERSLPPAADLLLRSFVGGALYIAIAAMFRIRGITELRALIRAQIQTVTGEP